jgi:hypothetical protein
MIQTERNILLLHLEYGYLALLYVRIPRVDFPRGFVIHVTIAKPCYSTD